jgi:hypothetical protein
MKNGSKHTRIEISYKFFGIPKGSFVDEGGRGVAHTWHARREEVVNQPTCRDLLRWHGGQAETKLVTSTFKDGHHNN